MNEHELLLSERDSILERTRSIFHEIPCAIDARIAEILDRWVDFMMYGLKDNPFIAQRRELVRAEVDLRANGGSTDSIVDDIAKMEGIADEITFWKKASKRSGETDARSMKNMRRSIQKAWREAYEMKTDAWKAEKIYAESREMERKMESWIMDVMDARESMDDIGIDQRFLDEGMDSMSMQDIAFLREWANILKDDENIKKISQLLGKMEKDMESPEETVTVMREYEVAVRDSSAKEEIVGIITGNNILDIIPKELSLLDEASALFDIGFIENKLMCFEREGSLHAKEKRTAEETITERMKRGPMIICTDTSGSMSGTPENIAKAVTLHLASKAMAEGRGCFLVNFGTETRTMDLTPPKGISELMGFLRLSFHGGTDVRPALEKAVSALQGDAYGEADVLMISDFLIHDPKGMDLIGECRKNGTRFYSLAIGSFSGQDELTDEFDASWTYEPESAPSQPLYMSEADIGT